MENNTTTKIQTGSAITATSICDSNCKWTATVIERKGNFITAKIDGETIKKKVNVDYKGEEYVYLLGKYSMAPVFKLK
jgi:hypothetical protein